MRRRLIRILLSLAGLFVLVVLAVKIFVSPEVVKEFVFEELEARTGIHAEADEASIQFPWPVGLRLKGLRLNTPDDDSQGLRLVAEVEEALATADLMSLLRKEPQIQEVRLGKPRLEVWLSESETLEGDGEAGALPPVEEPASADAAGVAIALSLLSIDEGRIVVHQADGSTNTLEGLRQRVRFQIDADQNFSGRLETAVRSVKLEGGSRELPLQLGELSAELLVSGAIEPLSVRAQISSFAGEGLSGKGKLLYELREEAPYLDADIEWDLDPSSLLTRVRAATAEQEEDPLDGIALALESISGRARVKGMLPESSEDPAVWLPLLELSGVAEGIQIGAFGRDELLKARTQFRLDGDRVVLEPVELRTEGAKLEGRLTAPALGLGSFTGKLSLQAESAALQKNLHGLWPALPESLTAKSTPPEEWPKISGPIEGELVLDFAMPTPDELPAEALQATLRVVELTVLHPAMAAALLIREGNISFDLERANIERLRLSTDGLEGGIEGVVDSWPEKIRFVGQGRFAELDLDRLRPEEPEAQSRGPQTRRAWWDVAVAHAATGDESFVPPANMDLQMSLHADQLRTQGYTIRDLKCLADLSEQVLHIKDLDGKLGEGRLVGEASVDWTLEKPRWKTRIQAVEVPAHELLDPVSSRLAQALQTSLNGMIRLEADLSPDREMLLQSLSGGGALKGSAGELITTVLLGDGLNALPGDAAEKLRVIVFKDFLTTVRFEAGRAHFNETVLRGSTQLSAEGWAGFDGQVDYGLELKLPVGEKLDLGALSPLAEFLREPDGRITIPVRVSGPGKKPKISLELGAAEARAKDAAKDDIEDKVKGFLKGLGGKKGGG